jgi:hypothetical protein
LSTPLHEPLAGTTTSRTMSPAMDSCLFIFAPQLQSHLLIVILRIG